MNAKADFTENIFRWSEDISACFYKKNIILLHYKDATIQNI